MIDLQNRKIQIGLATVLIYGLTIFTMITTLNQSHSFLQWSIKMTKGINFIILSLFILLNTLLSWQLFTTILFGELRLIEQEHIFERLPFTVISMIMVTSSFNDKQILSIVLLTAVLLVSRVSHWILKDRLESLLQHINNDTRLIHLFFSNFTRNMLIFAIIDYFTSTRFYFNKIYDFYQLRDWNNIVSVTFGIEFTSIAIDFLNILLYTILNFYAFQKTQLKSVNISIDRINNNNNNNNSAGSGLDNESDNNDLDSDDDDDDIGNDEFENKFVYEKSIDLFTRFLKLLLHLSILIPLNFQSIFFKDLFWDVIILFQSGNSLFKIYKNNKKLEDKLPTITIWDLKNHDNTCIVCMDDLVKLSHERRHEIKLKKSDNENNESEIEVDDNENITQSDIDNSKRHKMPKILPCGHMLHFSCLKNWMERSQTCPICRVAVFDQHGNVRPVKHQSPPPSATTNPQTNDSSIPIPTPTSSVDSNIPTGVQHASDHHNTNDNNNNGSDIENSSNNNTINTTSMNSDSKTAQLVSEANTHTISHTGSSQDDTTGNANFINKNNQWFMFPIMSTQKDRFFFKIKNKDISGKNVLASLEIKENDNIQDGNKIIVKDTLIHKVHKINENQDTKGN